MNLLAFGYFWTFKLRGDVTNSNIFVAMLPSFPIFFQVFLARETKTVLSVRHVKIMFYEHIVQT